MHHTLLMMLQTIPGDPENPNSGTQFVRSCANVISSALEAKGPDQIAADHDTSTVFADKNEPSTNSINNDWWNAKPAHYINSPQVFYRALYTFGPVNEIKPPYHNDSTEGILCQPHAENNSLRPIEFLANHVLRAFSRSEMSPEDVMEGWIDIFTSTNAVRPDYFMELDDLSFVFVKQYSQETIRAKRLDLVHALRVLFYTGHLVLMANPEAFDFAHPLRLITNVFLAQVNFFPHDSDMDQPLSPKEKNDYLLKLGIKIFERLCEEFYDSFLVSGADLFPVTFNPTLMPAPSVMAILNTPLERDEQQLTEAYEQQFTLSYFLFGQKVSENKRERGRRRTGPR